MSASTTAVVAAIAAQRRKLIGHFVAVGALSSETAVPAGSVPRFGFHMLERLKADGVICATASGDLYLDQARAAELQARRQAMAARVLCVAVALGVVVVAIAVLTRWSSP